MNEPRIATIKHLNNSYFNPFGTKTYNVPSHNAAKQIRHQSNASKRYHSDLYAALIHIKEQDEKNAYFNSWKSEYKGNIHYIHQYPLTWTITNDRR